MDFVVPVPTCGWWNCAGVWEERVVIPNLEWWPKTPANTFRASFMAQFTTKLPTCLRFHNPYLLKDGRLIFGFVEEKGEPGEPGWEWRFFITERIEGPVIWHVETTDCPKVSEARQ